MNATLRNGNCIPFVGCKWVFFPKRPKGMINNLKSIFRIYHCFQSSNSKAVINTLMQNELQIEGYNSESIHVSGCLICKKCLFKVEQLIDE